jgi:hypothetical protein
MEYDPPVSALSFRRYWPATRRTVPPEGSSVNASGIEATGQSKVPLHTAQPSGHAMSSGRTQTSWACTKATRARKARQWSLLGSIAGSLVLVDGSDKNEELSRDTIHWNPFQVTVPRVSPRILLMFDAEDEVVARQASFADRCGQRPLIHC